MGGSYTEGIIGSSRYFNPLLSQTNDADRDLTQVIFSGLLKYDGQGNLLPDLAERYEITDSGKTYTFYLRKNIFWQDGKPLNADDIIFTVQIIQNADFKSPLWSALVGVQTEKVDDYALRFHLTNSFPAFLYVLTFGVLPKHLWQNVSAADFALNEKNLKPIGSGPYIFKKLTKNSDGLIQSVELQANRNYYLGGPFINQLIFKFYPDEQSAIAAWRKGEIEGISYVSAQNGSVFDSQPEATAVYDIALPRYFALFINQTENKTLADKNVRLALAYAINKKELIDKVLYGFAQPINSPILPGMLGYSADAKSYDFDQEKAKNILQAAGWIDKNGDGIREKDGKNLEFSLVTSTWSELTQTADLLKDELAAIGVKVDVESKDASTLQQENIKPRQYQTLLFGEILNIDPDPFYFWHSSQMKDPGLNLSLYDNAQVDAILQDARHDSDPASRAKKYQQFSQIIAGDLAAIFLYSPHYLYPLASDVKGVDLQFLALPSNRFSQIEKWYIETKRVWK